MKKLLLSLFLTMALLACNDGKQFDNAEANEASGQEQIKSAFSQYTSEYIGVINRRQLLVEAEGSTAYLYKKGQELLYKEASSEPVVLNNSSAKRYWLYKAGKYIYAFWWVKFTKDEDGKINGKSLYVQSSQDNGATFSSPLKVNNDYGILPDIKVSADESGHITVVYLDERYRGHQIFTNSSKDGGKTWLKQDIQLNQVLSDADKQSTDNKDKKASQAVTPNLQRIDNKLIAVWEQIEIFDRKPAVSFVSRTSTDFGMSWSESEVIDRDFVQLSIELYTSSLEKNMYLFAVLEDGMALYRKDLSTESKWQRIKGIMPGSHDTGEDLVSYFQTVSDKENIYISYIKVEGNKKTDNHTEFQVFNHKDKSWGEHHRFDALKDSAKPFSRSYFQDIALLDDGTIVLVWEDYRGILPSIFLNYSLDKGKTWRAKPIPLNKVGLESASFPFIKVQGDNFNVFYKYNILANAIKPITKTRQINLPTPRSEKFAKIQFPKDTLPSPQESRKMIEKRFSELAKLRKNKTLENMQKQWDFYDPIFKSSQSRFQWINKSSAIEYLDMELKNISFQGALAKVTAITVSKMTKDFPPAKANPELLKPKKEVGTATWGWFYDNWYLIPDNPRQSYLP